MDTFQDRIIEYQGTEIAELKQRVTELEAQLAQWETFYKSEMQRERDNYNAAIKNANNIIAQLKEYERGAWNAAIEAAANVCYSSKVPNGFNNCVYEKLQQDIEALKK